MAGKYDERMDAAARAASVEIDASFMPGGGIAEQGEAQAAGAGSQPREFKVEPTRGAAPVAQADGTAVGELYNDLKQEEPLAHAASCADAAHESELRDPGS